MTAQNSLFKDCYLFAHNITAKLENCKICYSFFPKSKPYRNWHFISAGGDNSYVKNCVIESQQCETEKRKRFFAIKDDFHLGKISKDRYVSLMRDFFNLPEDQYSLNDLEKEIEKIKQDTEASDSILENLNTIEHTTFKNIMQSCIYISDNGKVIHCTFENCKYSIITYSKISISDCLFSNCEHVIKCGRCSYIKYCQFTDCREKLIDAEHGTYASYCEFYNSVSSKDSGLYCLGFIDEKSFGAMHIEHCTFDGIKHDDYKGFIDCSFLSINFFKFVFSNPIGVYVSDCKFKHAETNGHIIDEFDGKKRVIQISNCTGLDNVNKEGNRAESFQIRHESGMNDPIGARLDETTVGVPGYTPDFVMVG